MVGHINESGEYVKGKDKPMPKDINSQFRDWSHDNQRKRLSGDIVQPRIAGKVNPEFVRVYRGEIADSYFTREQQDKADRQLGGIG